MSIEQEEPGSERWWREFERLDPQTQDNMLYDMEYEQATASPWSFGDTAPELDYPNYDLMQMSGGVDIPEYTSKGALDPFDLTQQGKRVNLAQDYGAAMLDNILSGMAGPGAYDTRAFTPTYDYGEPLNLKGRRKAETLANQGGYRGFMADQMLNEGKSPDEAEALMWSIVETPDDDPDLTPEDAALKKSILSTLPSAPVSNQPTPPSGGRYAGAAAPGREGRAAYDQEIVRTRGEELWNELMEDPEYAYEQGGQFFSRTPEEAMIKTPQMEFFDKYGLPYPTASYEDPQYLQDALDVSTGMDQYGREQQAAGFDERMAGLERKVSDAAAPARANTVLQKAWADTDTRPETEWDAMLAASRKGGDQTAAREGFRPGGTVKENRPWTTVNAAGDTVPFDFGKATNQATSWIDQMNPFGKRENPIAQRATQGTVNAQNQRRLAAAPAVQRASRAREAAKYRDPRLMDIETGAKLWAIAQQGRTPFNDAIALRQQGLRAQGL